MALVLADRVLETTTTSGTGTLTLAGATAGYRSFSTAVGNGNTTYYCIYDSTAQVWEIGLGTVGAGTLARTTVYSNSSGGTSQITLAGNTASVFAVYTASKSVNLDASGNVTALGTIGSATWNGTTVGVAYGGTGVTASSGANSVVLRDSNQNITANNLFLGFTSTVTAAGTTTLTVASTQYQRFTGSTTQTVKLPDATTLQKGYIYTLDNDSTGSLTIVDNASTTLDIVVGGSIDNVTLLDNSTSAGTWIAYGLLPANYDFGATSANFGGATLSNGVWNGSVVGTSYGGTGLSTFTAANNAIYSTSSSALAAGTLPTAAGGTGLTSFTANGAVYATSTSALATGTLPLASGGTNSTATATAGGISYGTGTAYAFSAAGTTGQVLTSAGSSAPTWTTPVSVSLANTWTGSQTFSGSTSVFAAILANSAETTNVVAAAPSATTNIYLNTGAVQYYTTNAANTFVVNLAFSSGTTMNTALSTGQSTTAALLVTQGSSGASYYATSVQVDGTTTGVTTKWQGGAPTAGNASGIDSYTFTVIKTGSATYTVLASLVQFK